MEETVKSYSHQKELDAHLAHQEKHLSGVDDTVYADNSHPLEGWDGEQVDDIKSLKHEEE